MVQQLDTAPEAGLALRNDRVHRRNLGPHLTSHRFRRQTFRPCVGGRRPSLGQAAETHRHKSPQAMRERRSRRQRLAGFNHLLESSDCSCVSQVEMFQYLRRAPLVRGMPAQLLARHPFHCRLQSFFQLFQAGIHCATLRVPRASGRMLRDKQNTPVITGRFHEDAGLCAARGRRCHHHH